MTTTDPVKPDAAGEPTIIKKHSRLLSVLAILLALVGGGLMGWSFLAGIAAALDAGSGHSSLYIALFFIGAGLDIVAIVFALIGILRRAYRRVSVVALVLSLLPGLVVIVVAALAFL
jgi:hypothetical protein